MKTASTTAQTESLFESIDYGRSMPIAKVQYSKDGSWYDFDDVISASCSFANLTKVYGKFILLPPTSTCNVKLHNKNARYSPGSGTAFDGVLIRNRLIRIYLGYKINGINEYFLQGEYLIDSPSFNSKLSNYDASFTGRDKLKRAFEQQISCPTYAGADVAQVIRDIADRCGIPHYSGGELITDVGHTIILAATDTFSSVKAMDAFNECMIYLMQFNQNYRLELRTDGNLQLVIKSITLTNADYQLDYRYNLFSVSRSQENDKLLQRMTIFSKDTTASKEELLANNSYNSPGAKTLSWSGEATYKRIEVLDGTANASVFTLDHVNNQSIEFTLTGTPCSVTVNVYGDKLPISYTDYAGESIYWQNAKDFDGQTQKIVIRLCQSDSDARTVAESLTARYGNPSWAAGLNNAANPLIELGDRLLLWEKYTLSNTVYRVDGVTLSYTANGAALTQSLSLSDLGINITSFFWDRNTILNQTTKAGLDDFNYDKGLIWDEDLGVSVIEDTFDYTIYRSVRLA